MARDIVVAVTCVMLGILFGNAVIQEKCFAAILFLALFGSTIYLYTSGKGEVDAR